MAPKERAEGWNRDSRGVVAAVVLAAALVVSGSAASDEDCCSCGSDPNGLTGGLRFHVGQGGRKYGANVTFSCSAPGDWLRLQELFIHTFRTNEGTTFVGR